MKNRLFDVKEFDMLYKKNSQGTFEQWQISVGAESITPEGDTEGLPYIIVTQHGQYNGAIQTTSDKITKGKNIGRSNETSIKEQALAEANSKFEKMLKKGYVRSLVMAASGETDEIIKGGVVPMLAHVFDDHSSKLKFPCAVQPKLDGIRCLAIKRGDDVTLWSRTRKPITSCPHIIDAIKDLPFEDIVLDGELYNHDLKDQFEEIVSAVRKTDPSPKSALIQYHVYDRAVSALTFMTRYKSMKEAILALDIDGPRNHPLSPVYTLKVNTEEDLQEAYSIFLEKGYEGAMARNIDSPYENKRSYNLLKMKTFTSKEFDIVGAEEGRGKLAGKLGAFWCSVYAYNPDRVYKFTFPPDEDLFKATMAVPEEDKEHLLKYKDSYLGQSLEVKFQGSTEYGLPRFPIGMRVREPGL